MDSQNKRQINKNTNFWQSLGHARDGIVDLFTEERNFRSHIYVAILVIIIGLLLHLKISNWEWLLMAIFFVIIMEAINTVIENVVDMVVGHHYNKVAKRVKDISAGGVLISALFAALIGCLIFIPALLLLI